MHSTHQQLEEKGYAVTDFLSEDQVQNLLSFYQKYPLPRDSTTDAPYLYRSEISADISYRQLVTQEIKKIFTSNIEALFPGYRIVYCNFISKAPNSPSVSIHQDPSVVDETSQKSFIIWCPLIDVNEQTGCLQVVSKSHLITSNPRPRFVYAGSSCSQDVVSLMQDNYLTTVPMKAGQALIFDGRSFHGSSPNLSTSERVVANCHIAPKNSSIHFCYRESQTSEKLEIFEVDDAFYDSYVRGQKPEYIKSLGVFDYEVEPLIPEQLVEFMNAPELKASKETGIRERLLSLFNLLRGSEWWFYKIPPLLAIAYAEILLQTPPPQKALVTLLALLASMFFVAAYGHVINDIFDIEVDRRADKPNRMAVLSISQRLLLCISLAVAGLVPWLLTGFSTQSALLLAGIYTLLTIYSAPPLRLKERGFWGVMTDAAAVHAVPTLFIATVLSQITNLPQPESVTLATVATLWAALVGIRGIVLHQIWDRENDVASGVNTLVVRIGIEPARSWLSFLIFPCEILLLGLLMFVISQFAPPLGGVFAVYIILRGINTHLTSPPVFDPAPAQRAYVPAHDFYEAWLPLTLLVLLSIREATFIPLLAFHVVLFYPAIVKRLVEFNPLLLAGRKAMTTLISSVRHQPVRAIDSRQLAKPEVPTETFSESPSNELERSIAKAVDFLAQSQLADGEFGIEFQQKYGVLFSQDKNQSDSTEKIVFDSSPFATSLILYALGSLKHEPKVQRMIKEGLNFLLEEMEPGGLWRYWSSKNQNHTMIPPDLDDICCASHILRTHNLLPVKNKRIILANRNRQGLFYTWLLPRSFTSITLNLLTSQKALSHSNEIWKLTEKDDICCVVNANVLLYLGETAQTQKTIQHLINLVLRDEEDNSLSFYNHKLSFYYMLSRAYSNGVNSLKDVRISLISKTLSLQEVDGSFGDELLTALAVCTLLNFDCYCPALDKAIDFLLKTQQLDGSWKTIPMYGGQLDKALFGSAELTTAFCLEALTRYRLLDGVGKLQQDRVELPQVQAQFQQTEQELAQSQSQLHTTQTELTQAQSELQTSKTELARLKSYLHQTQGTLGLIDYYRHAIATNPDDLQLYYQALEIQPDDAQFHLQLGNTLVKQGQINEAISRYQTALQFHPDNFEIHLELGKALEKEKRWDEAIAAYRRAIDLNPNHSLAHQHLGDALAERGQLHEASVSYRRSLQVQSRIS